MKRKSTKEILAESFRELAKKSQVNKITIHEITDNCGYSPATFYRHFKDKYDLIAWDYVYRTDEFMSKVGIDDYKWKDTLKDGIKYFINNKEYMKNLVKNTGGHDAFVRYLSEGNIRHLKRCVLKLSGQEKLDNDLELLVNIYCFGTCQTICQWLLGEIQCDEDHLAEIFEQALPDKLRAVLCK